MGEAANMELDADAAVKHAFDYFDKFVARGDARFSHVLLEGLEPKDDEWIVSIGFDQGRYKETASSGLPFGESSKDPIREIRRFHISARDGALRRIA
ncbi:hypothetical protein [Roseovarius salis]|uniref:hypothetical protein n=1 Tax=Roseovarius salis TaxID=3376063 RepID=UPI0037C91597